MLWDRGGNGLFPGWQLMSLIPDPVVDLFNAVAPDVPLARSCGVYCTMLAIIILCFFPEIATWLPDHLMGKAIGPK